MREKELLLRRRMKDPIWRRLMDKSPAGTNPEALLNQRNRCIKAWNRGPYARIGSRPLFWREHRYGLITDSLLTNRQSEYAPKQLRKMCDEQPNSAIYKKMIRLRQSFVLRRGVPTDVKERRFGLVSRWFCFCNPGVPVVVCRQAAWEGGGRR